MGSKDGECGDDLFDIDEAARAIGHETEEGVLLISCTDEREQYGATGRGVVDVDRRAVGAVKHDGEINTGTLRQTHRADEDVADSGEAGDRDLLGMHHSSRRDDAVAGVVRLSVQRDHSPGDNGDRRSGVEDRDVACSVDQERGYTRVDPQRQPESRGGISTKVEVGLTVEQVERELLLLPRSPPGGGDRRDDVARRHRLIEEYVGTGWRVLDDKLHCRCVGQIDAVSESVENATLQGHGVAPPPCRREAGVGVNGRIGWVRDRAERQADGNLFEDGAHGSLLIDQSELDTVTVPEFTVSLAAS